MATGELAQVGIFDTSFCLQTVAQLVSGGIIERPIDGNHGEIHPKGDDFVLQGVPFVMASDIENGVVNYSACAFITRKQADGLRKGFAKNGDVLLTHKATIGRTAIVDYHEQPYVMLTPQVTYYRVRDACKLSNRYLRYYFESAFFQGILSQWAGAGSTRAYLGIIEQGKLPIVLPPVEKQKKIAAVLSAYDDLIENNQRRIALLERMAEQLYREWFVRFRFPGYQHAKFEKGLPAGWKQSRVAELVVRQSFGRVYKEHELSAQWEGGVIVIDQSRNDFLGFHNGEPQHHGSTNRPILLFGDHTCKMVLMTTSFSLAENVIPFRPKDQILPHFLFHMIRDLTETTEYKRHWTDLCTKHVLSPPQNLQEEFENQAIALHEQQLYLQRSCSAAERARDLLLPRLISGKLRVDQLDIQFPPSMQAESA